MPRLNVQREIERVPVHAAHHARVLAAFDLALFAVESQHLNSRAVLEGAELDLDQLGPKFVEPAFVDKWQALQAPFARANARPLVALHSAGRLAGHPWRALGLIFAAAVAPINKLQRKVPRLLQGSR